MVREAKTEVFMARMGTSEKQMLTALADADGLAAADVVRLLVRRSPGDSGGLDMSEKKPGGRFGALVFIIALLANCGTTIAKQCDILCPNGVDTSDPSGCTCIADRDASVDAALPDEMPCPGDGPPPRAWDGGALLGKVGC